MEQVAAVCQSSPHVNVPNTDRLKEQTQPFDKKSGKDKRTKGEEIFALWQVEGQEELRELRERHRGVEAPELR